MKPSVPFEPSFYTKVNTVTSREGAAVNVTTPKQSQTQVQLDQIRSNITELERIAEILQQKLSPILTGSNEPRNELAPRPVATPLVGELSSISDRTMSVISQLHQIINNIDI